MSEELKPCPFCGGDPITEFACTPDGDGAYFVHCQHEDCPAWPNTQGDTEAEAIAAWNHRQSATTEALVAMEQAREVLERAQQCVGPGYVNWHFASRQALATLTEQIERMRGEAQTPSGAMTGE